VKYSDEQSKQHGDWTQCQGKGNEWYDEHCVGAQGRKQRVQDADFNV